jgi:hypothetical protein
MTKVSSPPWSLRRDDASWKGADVRVQYIEPHTEPWEEEAVQEGGSVRKSSAILSKQGLCEKTLGNPLVYKSTPCRQMRGQF